jgi:ABC-type branched-subunit amino acid transport system substrate-binding protein
MNPARSETMIKIAKSLLSGMVGAALLWTCALAQAESGVSATEIRIGMANALSGSAKGLGSAVKKGSEVYFNKVNAAGGVDRRKILLLSEDDGYEPTRAAAATRKLIEQDHVFALFGFVGTPTSQAAESISSKAGVPFFGAFTGAEFLRSPVKQLVFNVRASYVSEAELQVEHLVKDLGVKRIGIFIQADAYGLAGKDAVIKALKKRNMELAGEGRYQRNTEEIDAGIAMLKSENPEAVIMVCAYKACAALVKRAKESGLRPTFLSLSFIGTEDFIKAAGLNGEGVYITQVMPSPDDVSIPLVRQYQADMRGAGIRHFDYASLEGYIDAVVFVAAVKAAGPNLTRESLVAALNRMKTNIDGLEISFGETDHQGLKQVQLTKVQNGKAMPISKL